MGEGDPGGVYGGGTEAVLGGLVAEAEYLGSRGVGAQKGVVENGGEVLRRGKGVGSESFRIKCGENGCCNFMDCGVIRGGAQVKLLARVQRC